MTIINLEDHRIPTPIPSIYLIRDWISPEEETYLSGRVDHVGNSNAVVRPDLSIAVRAGGWQQVNGRRSMYWGGTMTPKGKLIPQRPPSFMTEEWPHFFKRIAELKIFNPPCPFESESESESEAESEGESDSEPERKHSNPNVPPNHCLVNEYNPGDGILPHLDGPAYFPTVATISLESDTVYDFHCYSDRYESLSARLNGHDPEDRAEREKKQADEKVATGTVEGGRAIARQPLFSLFVPRRSLIIISGECYTELLHSIPARPVDLLSPHLQACLNWSHFSQYASQLTNNSLERGRRVSLTCRRVERVVKGLEKFLK
ncbi:hypothetical protein MJO29_000516 [Puccinia striiformis f. sp. tritici]|nr:hypothetical protein Pst134EB_001701 [Puccinia striiformis f. sp. tritici]KAI7967239.1 hypothetical protein MJO29_000516 [Puccinia striiformis f. sp. tritici]